MAYRLVPQQRPAFSQQAYEDLVGILHIHSRYIGNLLGESRPSVDRINEDVETCGLKCVEVGFAVCRCHVNQPRAFSCVDRWAGKHPEGPAVPFLGEVLEGRLVFGAEKRLSRHRRENLVIPVEHSVS